MSKYDSFFESPPDEKFNNQILKAASLELEFNKKRLFLKRLMMFFVPALTAMASIFIFKIGIKNENEDGVNNLEHIELLSALMEDEETIDLVEDLALLEDLEYLDSEELES